jgi:hypothetical protein
MPSLAVFQLYRGTGRYKSDYNMITNIEAPVTCVYYLIFLGSFKKNNGETIQDHTILFDM